MVGYAQVNVLEQSVKPRGKVVQQHLLHLQSMKLPSRTMIEPVADDSGRRRPAKVVEEVEISVTGKVWAYRPKAK